MLAIDCETTGLDLRHGAKPFMVQFCDDKGVQTWYEWDVDPLTRQPDIPKRDLGQIQSAVLVPARDQVGALAPVQAQGCKRFQFLFQS